MEFISYLFENFFEIIVKLETALLALIAFFMVIPGQFPEKQLQAILDFIKKFSRK